MLSPEAKRWLAIPPRIPARVECQPMTETEKAYIAGLVDGEAHVGIHPTTSKTGRSYSSVVRIKMTDYVILHWLREVTGLGVVHKTMKREKAHHKDRATWQVSGHQALAFLREILPYLKIKARAASNAILLQEVNGRYRGGGAKLTKSERAVRDFLFTRSRILTNHSNRYEGHPILEFDQRWRGVE